MTDTELIEKVAKWCELKHKVQNNKVLLLDKSGYGTLFNPLTFDNGDLMTKVVPKLLDVCKIELNSGDFYIMEGFYEDVVGKGNLSDLPRAVCELIAEIES